MPAVALIDEAQATGQVREIYKRIKDSLGVSRVPNIFQAMGHVPNFLSDMLENHLKTMGEGALDRKTKELLAVAVSAVNGCDYCVSVHSVIGKRLGLTDEHIAEALALTGIMSGHNQLHKFKDNCNDEAFKSLNLGMTESLLKQKSLSDLQAELLFVLVSTVNGCHTCIRYHVSKAKKAGATHQQFTEALAVMHLLMTYVNFVKAAGVEIDIK